MPNFVAKNILNYDSEKSSLIAASCEVNIDVNDLYKSKVHEKTKKFSEINFFKELFLLNLLTEVNKKKNFLFQSKNTEKKYFCNFIQNKTILVENTLLKIKTNVFVELKKKLKMEEKKGENLVSYNDEFYVNQNRMFFVEKEISMFVFKYKHQGCNKIDLAIYVEKSRIISSQSKRLFSKFFLKYLEKINLLKIKKDSCYLSLKIEKYIIENIYFNIPEENKKKKKKKILAIISLIFAQFFFLPPCLTCPILYECHAQSEINPFDCIYLKRWMNKNKF